MLVSGAASSTPSAGGCNERHTVTANGDVQHSTAQSKIDGSSIYFDGTGDYLDVASSTDFNYASDFTVESWVYKINNDLEYWIDARNGSDQYGFYAYFGSGSITWGVTGGWSGNTSVSNDTWHHFAFVRNSGTAYFYIDGVSQGSGSMTDSNTDARPFVIGVRNTDAPYFYTGYMDELRFSDTARYPSGTTFTPSTTSFNCDSNTVLLIHSDNTNGSTTFVGNGHI
jgi:hypothetical protein